MKLNFFNLIIEIITILSIIFALAVITSTNPVIAIIFLIGLFLTVAIYLILMGLNFIGLSYLLVYIFNIFNLFNTLNLEEVFILTKLSSSLIISLKFFSTISSNNKLNPWAVTGFTDAEGSFILSITPNSKYKLKWSVIPTFSITLNIRDLKLLEELQYFFGVGKITIFNNKVLYRVSSIKDLEILVEHFNKYPLITAKYSDYVLFKQACNIIKTKDHLSEEGLLKLVSIKSNLNLGLTDNLKNAFPNIIAIDFPLSNINQIPDPYWLSGFFSGDGSLYVRIDNSTNTNIGKVVNLNFSIVLHKRDTKIIKFIAQYLNVDPNFNYQTSETNKMKFISYHQNAVNLKINNYSLIKSIIIPFFNKHPLIGGKAHDFLLFKEIALIMGNKEHLNETGLIKIIEIKNKMNNYD